MDTTIRAIITANAKGLTTALDDASRSINDSTSSWQQRLKGVQTETSNITASLEALQAVANQNKGNIQFSSEEMASFNQAITETHEALSKCLDELSEMKKSASDWGVSVEAFQEIKATIDATGSSTETVASAFQNFNNVLVGLANANQQDNAALQELGVTLDDLASMSPEDKLVTVGELVASIGDESKRNSVSIALFGSEFNKLSGFVTNFTQEAQKAKQAGNIVTSRDIAAMHSYAAQVQNAAAQMEKMATKGGIIGFINEIRKGINSTTMDWKQMAGTMFRINSVSSILQKGFDSLFRIAVAYYKYQMEGARMEADAIRANAKSMQEISDEKQKLRDETDNYTRKLQELNNTENLSNTQRLETQKLVQGLTSHYRDLGIQIDATTGKVKNLDEAMAKKAGIDHKRSIQEVETELKDLFAARSNWTAIAEKEGGFMGLIINQGSSKVDEASAKVEEINKRIYELQKKIHGLRKEDPEKELREKQKAKRKDEQWALDEELSQMVKTSKGEDFDAWHERASKQYHTLMGKATTDWQRKQIEEWFKSELEKQEKARDSKEADRQSSISSLSLSKYGKERQELKKKAEALREVAKTDEERAQIAAYERRELARIAKEEADEELAAQKKLEDEKIASEKRIADARKQLLDAQEQQRQTMLQRELASYDRQAAALEGRAGKLQAKIAGFGFAGQGDDLITNAMLRNAASRSRAARKERRLRETDESISDKISRMRAGEHVSFSASERRRIRQYNKLKKQEYENSLEKKQLDAAKTAMEAAEEQKDAAKEMEDAGEAIEKAAKELRNSKGETAPQPQAQPVKKNGKGQPGETVPGETVPGVGGEIQPRTLPRSNLTSAPLPSTAVNYTQILASISRQLEKNTFVVG
ncbi:MAG: hypothetical protein IJS08_09010 [Victivallales bacterium]|nr:hypothetical protein [Victivallales bacterium]